MEINSKELQKALAIVKPAVATHDIVEQATTFAFTKKKVIAYNEKICIQHPLSIDIQGSINADILYKFISKAKETIDLTVEDGLLKIKSGKAKAEIAIILEIKIPIIKTGEDWKDIDDKFLSALNIASQSTSKDPAMEKMQCVHINKEGFIEGTDGFKLYHAELNVPVKTLLVFGFALKEIKRLQPTQITVTDGWCHFKNKDETILSCRTIKDDFADTSAILKGIKKGIEIVFPKTIKEILDRAEIFTESTVDFTIEKGKLTINATSDIAKFKESTSIDCKDFISFRAIPGLLKNILDENPKCFYNTNRLIFTKDNWKYVVLINKINN